MFIVFEGCDGVGKTTAMQMFADIYKSFQGAPPVMLRASEYNDKRKPTDMPEEAVIKNVASMRRVQLDVINYLNEGEVVLCDRWYYSTFAYQYAEGVDEDMLFSSVVGLLPPHVVFYIRRNNKEISGGDFIEDKGLEFQERVEEVYNRMFLNVYDDEGEPIMRNFNSLPVSNNGSKNELYANLMYKYITLFGSH